VVEPWSSEADVKVAALHQESQNAPDWLPSTLRVRMEGKAVRRVREDRKFSLLRCAIEPWQRRTRQECASPRKSRALLTEPLLPQKPPLAKQRGKKKRKAKSSLTSAGLLMEGSATALRRTRRGLDTSLPSRPFLRYVGNGEVCKPAITVRGYDRGLAQYRDRRFCQPRPPVWESNAVLRFESQGCQ
jgi:hypothetical protein